MKTITFDQVAAMNMHYQRTSFETFINSIDKLGVKNFELWAGSPHFCNSDSWENPVPKMKKMVAQRGMKIVCVTPEQCLYPVNIAAADDILRARSVEYFKKYVQQTAELEVERMLLTSGWGNFDETVDEAWKRSADSIREILKTAEKEGVEIAFEILLPEESNLVNNLATTQKMLAELDSPMAKCCIDTVPVCNEGKSLEEFFQVLGDKITHIHLNDGTPTGHMTWGDGEQPLEEHLKALSKHGYKGYMTLELGDEAYYPHPEEDLLRGLNTLKKYLPYTAK
ncbi:sugar phosphate isomerase/epimerase family protein [Youxingia wuxianensis]|uniref:TIM barrel protein n=1 Tax=Youxingia wuxianensis TaxID=2763678 RepID=A0A926EP59_9FIRM|nr:TIM barrel protein [Youxingia wuxianensis]MBC8585216.1 TIM barrel protein [Youxingia wuxianensis]